MSKFRRFWERFVAVMLMPEHVMGQTSAYQQKLQTQNKVGLLHKMRSIRSYEQTEL